MADCLFCKITKKEIPAQIVFEDDWTVGILDVSPRALGHAMIIPKIHSENILGVPEELIKMIFSAVKKLTRRLNEVFKPDGFTIGINQGRASGQAVDHLHIHIIPRWHNDGGGSIHSVVNNQPTIPLEQVKNKILKNNSK